METEILLVSGDFVKTGGMDLCNYHLATFLAQKGAVVHIISHLVDGGLAANPKVRWHKVPRPYHIQVFGERLLRMHANRFIKKASAVGNRVVLNGGNWCYPGVNWVHYVHAATTPFKGAGVLRTAKDQVLHTVAKHEEGKAFKEARVLISNSDLTKAHIIQYYGVPESKIHTVYCGCDKSQFFPVDAAEKLRIRGAIGLPQDKFLVTFVGGLGDERKGFPSLFQAWEKLEPAIRDNSQLVVVGRGSSLNLWKERAAAISGGGGINFLGFRKDVPDILKASDAFVAPTRYEPFGMAIQEALYCGLPVIASRSCGVAERIPLDCGELLLDDPTIAEELREKLSSAFKNYPHHRAKALQVSQSISSYSWDDMSSKIAVFVENLS